MYYFNARWYDPTLGRFISEDPARDGGNWFAYCDNNPLAKVDNNGETPFYFDFIQGTNGWREGAPQQLGGYCDAFDDAANAKQGLVNRSLGFNIDATKFSLKMATLRLWKGSYGNSGGGAEIGFYTKEVGGWGASYTGVGLLWHLGLYSTSLEIHNSSDGSLIGQRKETLSFWTTVFKRDKNPGKENIYTVNRFTFVNEEKANDFEGQLRNALLEAKDYKYNRNESFGIQFDPNDRKTVMITWGQKPVSKDKK